MTLIPLSEIIEDVVESPAPPALPVSVVSPPSQEQEAYKRLGLTKQVLAAHTQKEEQAFLNRCRELQNARTFQKDCSTYLNKQRGPANAEGTNLLKEHTFDVLHISNSSGIFYITTDRLCIMLLFLFDFPTVQAAFGFY